MEYVIKFFYGFILPPGFFVLLLAAAAVLLFRRKRRYACFSGAAALLMYVTYIPLTGILMIHPLEESYRPPQRLTGDVIVMLGGGATLGTPDMNGEGQLYGSAANRLITVARLYRQTGLPIILSGGKVYPDSGVESEIGRRQLIALGVPADKIYMDTKSITTKTNALYTKKLLERYHFHKPILVTSAYHMRRAVLLFQQIDIQVLPYPTDYLSSRKIAVYPGQFVPSNGTLAFTALEEYVGILAAYLF